MDQQNGTIGGGPFHFVPWDGGCLFIGRNGGFVPEHAHYAIQIAFGASPGIRFRSGPREPWAEYAAALIPSRQPHAMDATQVAANAVLFVEPETREGRALTERWARDGICALPESLFDQIATPLFTAYQQQPTARTVEQAARRVVHLLTGGVEPAIVTDERIIRAIAHIRAHLDQPLTLDHVADVACLSPSRQPAKPRVWQFHFA